MPTRLILSNHASIFFLKDKLTKTVTLFDYQVIRWWTGGACMGIEEKNGGGILSGRLPNK